MLTQVGHICLSATDILESQRFYVEVLGLRKVFEFLKENQLFGFYVAVGSNTFIEVFSQPTLDQPQPASRPLMQHFCLETDDIDAFIAAVRGKGWQISDKKMGGDNTWQAWLHDPSGVAIEVQQYTAASSQFNGQPVIVDW
jgi:catechol 2,3-dioxygenase-like lactoylglutathione lyase family enzyme